jgi:Cu-processing system ATP-binding protein
MMNQATVELDAVDKVYDQVKVLNSMSLSVQAGEVLGLFGHNGAGKSTMMKMILGLIEPDAGSVTALGHRPTDMGSQAYRRQFGYLPENVSFYDHLSGFDVLSYFAKLKGYRSSEVKRLLKEVGLTDAAKRAVKNYSKGMRQRLGLAQALLGEPKLLLLDEPTVGLDPIATEDFYRVLDRLKHQGCSVILCSHVLPGVETHIDRAMIVKKGRVVTLGTLKELRNEASLPVEIRVQGLRLEGLPKDLSVYLRKEEVPESTEHLQRHFYIPQDKKLAILKKLSQLPGILDIDIHQPSLSDIYSYFQGDGINKIAKEFRAHE